MISMLSSNVSWWLSMCYLQYEEYSGDGSYYDQPIFNRVFNIFFQSKLLIYVEGLLPSYN